MSEETWVRMTGAGGLRGRLLGVDGRIDAAEPWTRAELDDGRRLLVPTEQLEKREDGLYHLRVPLVDLGLEPPDQTRFSLPVIQEELEVGRRVVETGRVRIAKSVTEKVETVDQPLLHEHVEIDRVPVGRVVEAAPPIRYEDDTMIIPLVEEVLVVEKRLVLREELRVRRRQDIVHRPQQITLRREDLTWDREQVENPPNGGGNPLAGVPKSPTGD